MIVTPDQVRNHRTFRDVRHHWRREHERRTLDCARCGHPIDHTRWPNRSPWALDVGHILEAHAALALGWPITRINSVANTQPEHSRCNTSAGATYRNARRGATTTSSEPITSGVWD